MTIAYTLAATAVICPYFFVYDYFIVNAAILIVATQGPKLKALHIYPLMGLWFAPVIPFSWGSALTPTFLWPLAALGAIVIWHAARPNDQASPHLAGPA